MTTAFRRAWQGLALTLLAAIPSRGLAGETLWSARYQVRFVSGTGAPSAAVAVDLQWAGAEGECPSHVEVGMAEDGFPKGYGAFVRDFAASGTTSTPVEALSTANGRYRLPVSARGEAGFSYSVVLEHDPAGWGPGPDEAPYRFEDGALWTGRALFIAAARSRAEVTFEAPAGDRVLSSFEPVVDRPQTFSVADETRLRDSFLVVGRPAALDLKVGSTVVTLALGGGLQPSLATLAEAVGPFLTASAALFGGAPPARILAVGNLGARKGSFYGGTFGDDVSFLVDEPLTTANARRWQAPLCHELFHLWNGRALVYDGQQYWMSEGFTDYYSAQLLARQGHLTSDDLLADFTSRMRRYLARHADLGLHAAGDAKFDNHVLVYEGGSLAALCLDLQIRHASANAKSLDDVMRSLYAEFATRPPRPITLDSLSSALSAAAGLSFETFIARHVVGHDPLPLAESLKLAGLEISPIVRDLPEVGWIAKQLLRCPSLTMAHGRGMEVLSSQGETLKKGDVITAIAGMPLRSLEDLRPALGDAAPGSTVTMAILREGVPMSLEVELGHPAGAPSRSRFVTLPVRVLEAPGDRALAIRRAVFGSGPWGAALAAAREIQ